MECEFCKKSFITKGNLKKHQTTAVYCLKIQNSNSTFECAKVECEFCLKIISKTGISKHYKRCSFKIKKDLEIQYKDMNEKLKAENKELKDILKKELEILQKDKINTKTYRKKSIPKAVRMKVWLKYIGNVLDGECYCCNREIKIDLFEAGHVISEHNGGQIRIDNLRPICKPCNCSCGTMNLDDFKKKMNDATENEYIIVSDIET